MTISKTDTAARKDVQKLQRTIVDGLEDVKAQDIQVFNTEHLSPLFERVIIASGTSNRQTKALASSVRDAVRDSGLAKPRMEGEENGEWIIVDCGAAVVHIMQPAIRSYYHLEEIWGETPVRLKLGAPKPAGKTPAGRAAGSRRTASSEAAPTVAARKPGRGAGASPASKPAAPVAASTGRKTATAGPVKKTAAKKAPAVRQRAGTSVAKPAAPAVRDAKAPPIKKVVIKSSARPAAKKSAGAAPAAGKRAAAASRKAVRKV
jgi:ribosome-associated protein